MSNARFTIPVQPHHAAYVRALLHLAPSDPVPVPGDSPVGHFLAGLFDDAQIDASAVDSARVDRLRGKLLVSVGAVFAGQGRVYLTERSVLEFDEFIHRLLREHLALIVHFGKANGIEEKDVIEKFITAHGLDDLIEFDALKKAMHRLRVARAIPHLRERGAWSDLAVVADLFRRKNTLRPPVAEPSEQSQLALSF